MIISVSEIQKNIGFFKNLTETAHIVDKKTKKVIAMVLPGEKMEKHSLTDSLGGILRRPSEKKVDDLEKAIDKAYDAEMRAKYGN